MTALAIAWNGLSRLAREREALFWIFVGPIIFVTFFGILFRPVPDRRTSIALVNRDETDQVARALTAALRRDDIDVQRADGPPAEGWGVTVPAGAAAAMRANAAVDLVLHAGGEETTAERSLRFKLQRALTVTYLQANPADTPAETTDADLADRLARSERVTIAKRPIGIDRPEATRGFQRSVPAYLVMFLFLNLLVAGAGISEERASGRLRRIFIAPVSKRDLIVGSLLSRVATGWVQTAYMLALGVFVFGIRWADHPFVLGGFLTLVALTSASLGLLLGTLFRDPDKCQSIAVWTVVLLSPLGGLWWPLEVVGPAMRRVGSLVPTGWAMEGVNKLLAFGADAGDVAPQALPLAALFVVSLVAAARRIRP